MKSTRAKTGRPKTREGATLRSVRFPKDIYESITVSAQENERSFSQEMIYRLRAQMREKAGA